MANKIVASEKGMTPAEMQRFAGRLTQAQGKLDDLTPGKLDRMIDEVQKEDPDLANYLYVKHALLLVMRDRENRRKALNGDLDLASELLRDAHVIACAPVFQDVLNYTDAYLMRALGREVGAEDSSPELENQMSTLANATVRYPEKLPFPSVYLSLGNGFHSYDPTSFIDLLMGILIGENAAWMMFTGKRAAGHIIIPACTYQAGRWTSAATKAPWCLVQLVDLINSYKSFIEEVPRSLKQKLAYEKMAKRMGLKGSVPPPYYHVKLKDVHIKERSEALFPTGRKLGHRHDRRGHERCKFRRGKLPMDAKLEAKLIKRGYELFKQNPMNVDAIRRLSLRGMPYKASDEWLAVKTTWVKNAVVGSAELPYVPSIHEVPQKGEGH